MEGETVRVVEKDGEAEIWYAARHLRAVAMAALLKGRFN